MATKKPNKNLILKNRIKSLKEDKEILFKSRDELQSRAIKAEKEVELKEAIIENLMVLDKRQRSERETFLASELERLQEIIRWFIKPSTADIKISKKCDNCGCPPVRIKSYG